MSFPVEPELVTRLTKPCSPRIRLLRRQRTRRCVQRKEAKASSWKGLVDRRILRGERHGSTGYGDCDIVFVHAIATFDIGATCFMY